MDWNQLLSTKRFGLEDRALENIESQRTQFQRDYDRLIFSSPFRRLQNKTQVFPLPGSVFVHNRLTHSLEVASVGRSLGSIVASWIHRDQEHMDSPLLSEMGTIVATACLAHDLGNPPFGHSGENAISNYFEKGNGSTLKTTVSPSEWSDLTNFEGNANAIRVLTHQFNGRRYGGYALTYSTLATIAKYPCESINGHNNKNVYTRKYGFFQAEKESYRSIADALGIIKFTSEPDSYYRHPLAFLVEAADDICYNIIDLEDAHRLGILTYDDTVSLLLEFFDENEIIRLKNTMDQIFDLNEKLSYIRANVINKLVMECADLFYLKRDELLSGKFNTSLFEELSGKSKTALDKVKAVSIERIYNHRSVLEIEVAGYKVLGGLLEEFVGAIMDPNSSYSKMLLPLVPQQYRVNDDATSYQKIMGMVDYVSGMTDVFAVDLYKKIKGISISLSD